MISSNFKRYFPFWFGTVLFLITINLLIIHNHAFLFSSINHFTGDFASMDLATWRAKHFTQILGIYSWNLFHHPGPIYFYLYALGEFLFYDNLNIVPTTASSMVLTHLIINSLFFTAFCLTIYKLVNKAILVFVFFGVSFLFFNANPNSISAFWPPYATILPFTFFTLVIAIYASGHNWPIFLIIVSGGFCFHAQLSLLPALSSCFVFAYFIRIINLRMLKSVSSTFTLRDIVVAVVLIGLFLLPIVLDLILNSPSNITAILAYYKRPSLPNSLSACLEYLWFVVREVCNINYWKYFVITTIISAVPIFFNKSMEFQSPFWTDPNVKVLIYIGFLCLVITGCVLATPLAAKYYLPVHAAIYWMCVPYLLPLIAGVIFTARYFNPSHNRQLIQILLVVLVALILFNTQLRDPTIIPTQKPAYSLDVPFSTWLDTKFLPSLHTSQIEAPGIGTRVVAIDFDWIENDNSINWVWRYPIGIVAAISRQGHVPCSTREEPLFLNILEVDKCSSSQFIGLISKRVKVVRSADCSGKCAFINEHIGIIVD